MRLLCIETSSSRGSLSLCEIIDHQIKDLRESFWENQGSHSEVISIRFEELLKQKAWILKDLTHIAVGIGPGSFTGIRVGLNFAKTLAYGLKLPLLGLDSLKILARPAPSPQMPVLSLINAYRNQVFLATYEERRAVIGPRLAEIRELETLIDRPHFCRGDGFQTYAAEFSTALKKNLIRQDGDLDFPSAASLAHEVATDLSPGKFTEWKSVNPLYIRAASAEEKLKGGALKPLPRF
jgi:tRNA threonylcarbamoyladenosine biosynthesis protein TsaB